MSERVRLVSDRMFEGQAGIKNRTCSAAGSIALARFGGRGRNLSSSGENRVEIRRSAVDYFGTRRENSFSFRWRSEYEVRQFEELLEDLKAGMVLSEKIESGGSFTGRPVGVRVISGTVELFTDEVFGISTVGES